VRQPRPNVLFELGWFCGRLGRGKVLFLCKESTRLHSDYQGVLTKVFKNAVTEPAVVGQIETELKASRVLDESAV